MSGDAVNVDLVQVTLFPVITSKTRSGVPGQAGTAWRPSSSGWTLERLPAIPFVRRAWRGGEATHHGRRRPCLNDVEAICRRAQMRVGVDHIETPFGSMPR